MASDSTHRDNAEIVRDFWMRIGAREFRRAADMLTDDYVCEWPQSNERIRGRENFFAVNYAYPGEWAAEVVRVLADRTQAASEVILRDGQGHVQRVVSFFTLRDGLIVTETDYWPDPYPPAEGRAQWVERMDDTSDSNGA